MNRVEGAIRWFHLALAGSWLGVVTATTPGMQIVSPDVWYGYICSSLNHDSRGSAFAAANNAAMTKMMAGMNLRPSGDVDRDFVAAMIPHHQGAIDMAVAELRYGSNEKLRRIAQEIVVAQQQEITAMHLALGQPLPPSVPAPTQVSAPAQRPTLPIHVIP